MNDLLPIGLSDRLFDETERQESAVRALLDAVAARGYRRVTTPLAEYEDVLARRLKSPSTDLARFVDPMSQRTLAIRSDITPQIARLVATRLADAPRPLRLAYAGPVLKLAASQIAPERETTQVGAELIGDDGVDAAIELVSVAVDALAAAGVADVTVDLTLPDVVTALTGLVLPSERIARLDALLDMKDAGGLAEEGLADWLPLLMATGPVAGALDALRAFDHAGLLGWRIEAIHRIAESLADRRVRVTLDPTERHGFEYQSWFGFTLFAGARVVGRGGTYRIERADAAERSTAEPATGFSVFPDSFG